ncbi:S1C family serine protease [Paraliobacillus ryukyuensis]|uniref:S1C family serine protease n=1 Tax=Paraliobacillus ryukyuensis TaxID=200904 RepID=UPI0009A8840A|nr:trypsin-like peptidase domain-containing protein [Paraliobacillus ryukyuensis]
MSYQDERNNQNDNNNEQSDYNSQEQHEEVQPKEVTEVPSTSTKTNETNEWSSEQAATTEEQTESTFTVENNQSTQNPPKKPKQNRWAMFLSSLAGGITVAIIGFILLLTDIIPVDQNQIMEQTNDSNETSNVIQTSTAGDSISTETLSKVGDAVVGISNVKTADLWSQSPSQSGGTGSGVIYKKADGKAYIVTNHHVVEGADSLEVTLPNGETVDAQLLGSDELTDLAVLTIDGSNVDTVAELGTSSNLTVGQTAIAIGNPLGQKFAGSVTKGIVSGLNRSVEVDLNGDSVADWTTEVIQTDAAINPGNSGGALVNDSGEVIGINSMKIALQSVEGIGFAIPIDEAKPVIEQLETNGEVSRPFIGISAIALSTVPERQIQETLQLGNDVRDGVVIAEVQPGSAAENAGLERYDVITKINDTEITSMMDLKEYLYSETKIGDKIQLTYYRKGEQQTTSLTLTEQQDQEQQQQPSNQ